MNQYMNYLSYNLMSNNLCFPSSWNEIHHVCDIPIWLYSINNVYRIMKKKFANYGFLLIFTWMLRFFTIHWCKWTMWDQTNTKHLSLIWTGSRQLFVNCRDTQRCSVQFLIQKSFRASVMLDSCTNRRIPWISFMKIKLDFIAHMRGKFYSVSAVEGEF